MCAGTQIYIIIQGIMSAKSLLERRRKGYHSILNLLLLGSFLEFCCMCVHIYDALQGGIGWVLLPFCLSAGGT